MLVLKGDQRLWWMDGRWCYYSKYWTNTQRESGFGCTFVSPRICIHVGVRLWNTYLRSSISEHLGVENQSLTSSSPKGWLLALAVQRQELQH